MIIGRFWSFNFQKSNPHYCPYLYCSHHLSKNQLFFGYVCTNLWHIPTYLLDCVLSRCSLVGAITDMRCNCKRHTSIYMRCIFGCKWHKLVFAMHTVHGHGQCRSGGWWFRVKEFSLARIRDVPKLSRYNKKSGWLQKEREAKGGMEEKLSKLHFQASLKTASA